MKEDVINRDDMKENLSKKREQKEQSPGVGSMPVSLSTHRGHIETDVRK